MACMKLLAFAFLLISTLDSFQFMAQGRQFTKLSNGSTQMRNDRENGVKMRLLIGSRPPRCDKLCKSCEHCYAVQVPIPILPSIKYLQPPITAITYSRGEDISNYKPMCWKCKCGDIIFNP